MEAGQAAEVVKSELDTVIATDGAVRSEARFRVRNHTLQFLEIAMPEDSTLWSVSIDGHSISVSRKTVNGATVLLIPLQRMTETDRPVQIAIAYASKRVDIPALYTSYSPKAPRVLDVPVVETFWRIYSPEDYEVSRSDGNVKEVLSSLRDGSRVNASNIELARLDKIEKLPGQRPAVRKRARQSTDLEGQDLKDNNAALSADMAALNSNKAVLEQEARQLTRDELQSQMSYNSGNLSLGNEWLMKLSDEKRKKELEEANSKNFDPEEAREFYDRFNFLNIHWRPGIRAKKEAGDAAKPPAGTTLDELRFLRRFAGFGKNELPTLPAAPFPELDREALPAGGLFEDPAGAAMFGSGAGGTPSGEERAGKLRMVQLDFRSVEVHPEVTLTFRSKSATLRWGAIGGLLLLAVLAGVVLRKRRKI